MSNRYAARATRQGAVLAATAAFHMAAIVVVAASMDLVKVPAPADWARVFVRLPPAPQPVSVSRPDHVTVPDYTVGPVPEPDLDLDLRVIDEPDAEANDRVPAAHGEGVGLGVPVPPEERAPRLATRGDRLAALVDSCYPSAARRLGLEGRGVMRVVVDAGGRVARWDVAQSTGMNRLDSGMDCVARKLRFEPGRRDGHAVEVAVQLPVVFRLR
jgi:protein TonB